MKVLLRNCLIALPLFFTFIPVANAGWTNANVIAEIRIHASFGRVYVKGEGLWEHAGCAKMSWVEFRFPELDWGKEMLSLLMMAKAQGSPVQFLGNCSTYFRAYYAAIK